MSVALIVTLIVMIVAPVIVLSMNTDAINATSHNNRVHAYYYARSGIEYVVDTIMKDFEDLLINNVNNDDFYFYGSLESNIILVKGTYTTGHEDEKILIVVEWDGKNGKIVSSGKHSGVTEKITREFYFDKSSVTDVTMEILFNIGEFQLGSDPGAEDDLSWYSVDGGVGNLGSISQNSGYTEEPVRWTFTQVIYDGDNKSVDFSAPIMYFTDTHAEDYNSALKLNANSNRLTLKTNFIAFYGNVYFDEGNNQMGELVLEVYREIGDASKTATLKGSDISAKGLKTLGNQWPSSDTLYGLVYFKPYETSTQESTVIKVKNKVKSYVNSSVVPGFYYFPDGVNLAKNNSTGFGLESLVPVGFTDIDFSKLNIKSYLVPLTAQAEPEFGLYQ